MASLRFAAVPALALAALAAAPAARAELEVSLEISGSVDEIMAVLDQLKQAGLGQESEEGGEGLRLEVQSTATPEGAPAEAAPPPAPEPPITLGSVVVEPASVTPGQVLRVTVAVKDQDRVVDTVAANMRNNGKEFTFDLFDDGSHGDEAAGDGVRSVNVAVPGAATPGEYEIVFFAYDAAGNQVTLPNAHGEPEPVTASAKVTVQP
ncbi:MAG: hypothetical protein RLZZ303_1403 [Candidatus Hydrogenedentota bacterium]